MNEVDNIADAVVFMAAVAVGLVVAVVIVLVLIETDVVVDVV